MNNVGHAYRMVIASYMLRAQVLGVRTCTCMNSLISDGALLFSSGSALVHKVRCVSVCLLCVQCHFSIHRELVCAYIRTQTILGLYFGRLHIDKDYYTASRPRMRTAHAGVFVHVYVACVRMRGAHVGVFVHARCARAGCVLSHSCTSKLH